MNVELQVHKVRGFTTILGRIFWLLLRNLIASHKCTMSSVSTEMSVHIIADLRISGNY